MTLVELDSLPDVTSQNVALFQELDDGAYRDAQGVWWMTGWLDGKRVKRLFDHRGDMTRI